LLYGYQAFQSLYCLSHQSFRKIPSWILIFVLFLLITPAKNVVSDITDEIRAEAVRQNNDISGRPLPLASLWNARARGISPDDQLNMIQAGHHLLPAFNLTSPDLLNNEYTGYYAAEAIKRSAEMNLPISFVATQWESILSKEPYIDIDVEQGIFIGNKASESANPNFIKLDGVVNSAVSPFGPQEQIDLWKLAGKEWAESSEMMEIQELYPDPPLVVVVSNNEHKRLRWRQVENSMRYYETYISQGLEDGMNGVLLEEFRRKVTGDGWIERYSALISGFRQNFARQWWKNNSIFTGYEAFGPSDFRQTEEWHWYHLPTTYDDGQNSNDVPRIDPWHFAWEGASPSFYVHDIDQSTDYRVWSPQIESMNWLFMLEETYRSKPDFWFEISTWDGHNPDDSSTDKRQWYERRGQTYSPERYGGMVQFGMWLVRPRVVREFRYYYQEKAETLPYFMPVVEAVDRIYKDPDLQLFWRNGTLIANPDGQHPYQMGELDGYSDFDIESRYGVGRWFLLTTNLNPEIPINSLYTEIPVLSLALVIGEAPERKWLVYAHSPLMDRESVEITIPGYGSIMVDVAVAGSFYLVDEISGTVRTAGDLAILEEKIRINKGLNLISLPLDPVDNSPDSVLETIQGYYYLIWTYNAIYEEWRRYIPNGPNIPLSVTSMEHGYGYWINMNEERDLTITGHEVIYKAIPLKQGWNLVGYSSLVSKLLKDALLSIEGYYSSIWTYDSLTGKWLVYGLNRPGFLNDLTHLEPWKAYWIKVDRDCIWYLSTTQP